MRDPNPVVYLVPGVGMITFARDKATARIAGEFYRNAINVMRGASSVDTYVGLPEQEAFDIEYWLLEEAKLQRMPKPKSLFGRIAFVTGGASGIGRSTAARLLSEGAAVVIADIDHASLETTQAALAKTFGKDNIRGVAMDVTSEDAVIHAIEETILGFGGVDIVVSNAGISSAAPIEDTTVALWDRNMDILAKGYFLVGREAFRLMKRQKLGGAIVFVASKNGLAASVNASAYSTAKAAEIHLARGLALEGAPLGIRVNVVNPDAVLRGSKIWTGEWREQRAAAYNMKPDELEEHYPPAQPAQAQRAAGGRLRGDLFPGLRHEREIDRQHHQRRRRQRTGASRAERAAPWGDDGSGSDRSEPDRRSEWARGEGP